MSLVDILKNDVTEALKAGDSLRADTLRGLLSGIHNEEIAARGKSKGFTDEDAIKVLQKESKKRRESIEVYTDAGRNELADKEKSELDIIAVYLPPEMSKEEVEAIVAKVIESEGDSDNFGKVMQAVMKEVAGRAEAGVVASVVKASMGGDEK